MDFTRADGGLFIVLVKDDALLAHLAVTGVAAPVNPHH
jgi:hypothetical protein